MEHIKRIPICLTVSEFIIDFTYETKKGYYRQQKRSIKATDKQNAVKDFEAWGKKQRTMSNVKILGIFEIENSKKSIEL